MPKIYDDGAVSEDPTIRSKDPKIQLYKDITTRKFGENVKYRVNLTDHSRIPVNSASKRVKLAKKVGTQFYIISTVLIPDTKKQQ